MTRVNFPMFLISAAGGALAWFLGELFLKGAEDSGFPVFLTMGIYFAIFSVTVSVFALLAETLFPILNGRNWRREYCGSSWKHVLWVALLVGFIPGTLFQLAYDLDFSSKTRNIIMLIDNSGSMLDNDPEDKRLYAAANLIDTMENTNVSVISFSDSATLVQPFSKLSDTNRTGINDKIAAMQADGGTEIEAALNLAMQQIEENKITKNCAVILLSDGYSDVNFVRTLTPYTQKKIKIYSIGLHDLDNVAPLLKSIADYTEGAFYDVADARLLPDVFSNIYERSAVENYFFTPGETGNALNIFLKVLFLMLIGAAIGWGLALVFDNKYLLVAFIFGGAVGGLASAMILVYFLQSRLASLIILSSLFVLFSVIVKLPDNSTVDDGWKR